MVNEVLIIISSTVCLLFSINFLFIVPNKLKSTNSISEQEKTRKISLSRFMGLILVACGILLYMIYTALFL